MCYRSLSGPRLQHPCPSSSCCSEERTERALGWQLHCPCWGCLEGTGACAGGPCVPTMQGRMLFPDRCRGQAGMRCCPARPRAASCLNLKPAAGTLSLGKGAAPLPGTSSGQRLHWAATFGHGLGRAPAGEPCPVASSGRRGDRWAQWMEPPGLGCTGIQGSGQGTMKGPGDGQSCPAPRSALSPAERLSPPAGSLWVRPWPRVLAASGTHS